MELIRALQLSTLSSVMLDSEDDRDFQLRAIMRWYSRQFFTPLHQVMELPIVDVLTAYFEEKYEAMDPEDLEAQRLKLLETPAQKKARIRAEEAKRDEDNNWLEQVKQQEKERIASLPAGKRPALAHVVRNEGAMVDSADKPGAMSENEGSSEAMVQTSDDMLPVISMSFGAIDGPEDLDSFSTGPSPDKKH